MSKRADKRLSMSDVAAAAGVSSITVSRTLQHPQKVSPETRQRVEAAISRLNFVPNMAARTLASHRSRIVAAVVPNMAHSVFAETLQGIANVLRPANYQLLVGNSAYSAEEEESLVKAFLARQPDGIVLTGYTHSPALIGMIHASRIPVVEMWNLIENPINTIVGFSNFEAARAMTLYLGKKGYRRIGYIGGPLEGNDRTYQRLKGFRQGMHELGFEVNDNLIFSVAFDYQASVAAFQELLSRSPDLDAVFAAGDVLAVGVHLECLRRGWSIPERLAVAGFDDSEIASLLTPRLTTVRVPRYEIGKTVAEQILKLIGGSEPSARVIDLGFEIVERDSA